MTSLTLRLNNLKKKRNAKVCYDREKLRDSQIPDKFQAEIGGRFAPLLAAEMEPEEFHQRITENLEEAANKGLGKQKRFKQKPWVTDIIINKCDERRRLKQKIFISTQDPDAYRAINRDVRKAKESWIKCKCDTIESSLRANNTKVAYDTVKELTHKKSNQTTCIEDANGTLLSEKPAIIKRWHEYCLQLYNYHYQLTAEQGILQELKDLHVEADQEEEDPDILESEVESALKSLKLGKAPGIDNIPVELLTNGGELVVTAYTSICNHVFKSGEWPKEWTTSIIVPMPKKGSLKKCNNYRTISLISHPNKILLKVILKRLQPQAEAILSQRQIHNRANL